MVKRSPQMVGQSDIFRIENKVLRGPQRSLGKKKNETDTPKVWEILGVGHSNVVIGGKV